MHGSHDDVFLHSSTSDFLEYVAYFAVLYRKVCFAQASMT